MSDLWTSMSVSAMGMRAQGARIRMISENIANAQTAANTPESDPYRRQVITFKNEMDRQLGVRLVSVDRIVADQTKPFLTKYMPDHPGADARGYVRMPNVNSLVEMMDMREAQRSYEANLNIIEQSRDMLMRTIDILRS